MLDLAEADLLAAGYVRAVAALLADLASLSLLVASLVAIVCGLYPVTPGFKTHGLGGRFGP